jgi:zinc protease
MRDVGERRVKAFGCTLHRIPVLGMALWLTIAASSASAQDVKIAYEKFVLSNGLTVIVHEDHKAPIVALNIWYHVGSKNEKPGKTGFAHLFEHLMFGGSENLKGRYIDAMERVGATDLNGTTNSDRTNYFEDVPTSALDYALFVESDRMGHFYKTINKETLDLQRGVVQNEKRQGDNQPYSVSRYLITENTYPAGHGYSWTTIGSMEDLNAASLADVQEWFKTYYGPSNATLVIAGDIDGKTAREKVEKYFSDIPAGPPIAHQNEWIAKMTGVHRQQAQDRVPAARVFNVWNMPGYGQADTDYLDLVSDVLAAGKDSRLYKRLVYDEQIATSVSSGISPNEIGGQFSVGASAKPGGGLGSINKDVQEELDRFLKDGPTAEELERVKTSYEADLVRGLERIGGFGGKSDILARGQVFTGSPEQYLVSLERVRKATTEDLRDAARRWLNDGLYQLEVTPFPEYKAASTGADRSKLPEVGATPNVKLPAFERMTLSNGLKVVLAERHELPIVNFTMLVDAGTSADSAMTPGAAALTSSLLTSGTNKYNALQISDEIQRLGAEIEAGSGLDSSTVYLSSLKSRLEPSLALFSDVLLHPSFPQEDFTRQQKLQIAAIQRAKTSPNAMASRVLTPALYGKEHPYGLVVNEAGVAKLTRDAIAKFHEAWYLPNNATLVIVGDTTPGDIRPQLEKVFASWKPANTAKKTIPRVETPKQTEVYLIDKPGAAQSFIVAGTIAPPRNSPLEIPLGIWNDVLGGTFGGRVNMNLREDKHWSYGARTAFLFARGDSAWVTQAPVQTDKTKESLVELSKELRDVFGVRPITEDELTKDKANRTLRLAGSRETMTEVGDAIETIVQYRLPDDYFSTYGSKVQALTTSDLGMAGKSFLNPDRLVWVVVGDLSKVEAGIRELNLGKVQVVDADGKVVR